MLKLARFSIQKRFLDRRLFFHLGDLDVYTLWGGPAFRTFLQVHPSPGV